MFLIEALAEASNGASLEQSHKEYAATTFNGKYRITVMMWDYESTLYNINDGTGSGTLDGLYFNANPEQKQAMLRRIWQPVVR